MLWITLPGALFAMAGATLQEPLAVAEPERLALTPKVDGRLEPNEWDALAGVGPEETYLQWEPGRLHAAARVAEGQDLLVSADLAGDGWLVGRDNYQFRVALESGAPTLQIARLDAANGAGPVWVDASELLRGSRVAAAQTDGGWFVELTVDDSGQNVFPTGDGRPVGVRVDRIARGVSLEPFLPRAMAAAKLVFDRGSSVPGGLQWKPQFITRTVAPGQRMQIRLTFNGANQLGLRRIEMETRGQNGDYSARISYPFPDFDAKGRAFVDYVSPIAADAEPGFRLLRAVVTDAQGNSAYLRSSFRVAPMVEVEVRAPRLGVSDKDRTLRIGYYVSSNANRRLSGEAVVAAPAGWKLENAKSGRIELPNSRSSVRRVVELTIPAGAKGRFPLIATAEIGGATYSATGWIVVE